MVYTLITRAPAAAKNHTPALGGEIRDQEGRGRHRARLRVVRYKATQGRGDRDQRRLVIATRTQPSGPGRCTRNPAVSRSPSADHPQSFPLATEGRGVSVRNPEWRSHTSRRSRTETPDVGRPCPLHRRSWTHSRRDREAEGRHPEAPMRSQGEPAVQPCPAEAYSRSPTIKPARRATVSKTVPAGGGREIQLHVLGAAHECDLTSTAKRRWWRPATRSSNGCRSERRLAEEWEQTVARGEKLAAYRSARHGACAQATWPLRGYLTDLARPYDSGRRGATSRR